MDYEKMHAQYKEESVKGRYLNLKMITTFLESLEDKERWDIAGYSVQDRPIYKCQIGQGKIKVLMWSQMHGNESTTTKGVLDFLNLLYGDSGIAKEILENYSFCIIPMLNPDGAEVYTRVNANEVDLNRDFQSLSQPESRLLMQCYKDFNPDYCFNLHDQRTIFGVGTTGKPATVSFLAPSFNEAKEYDKARMESVSIIVKMNVVLESLIPGQIGRFDDSFNINCVGDTFQNMNTPTVLIEAGHFQGDYEREETRKFIFIALMSAFKCNNENVVVDGVLFDYLRIPQNIPNFLDFVYKNVRFDYEKSNLISNFAVQFKEELKEDKIFFNGYIAKVGDLEGYFGHEMHNMEMANYTDEASNIPKLDEKANFFIDNKAIFVNGLLKK